MWSKRILYLLLLMATGAKADDKIGLPAPVVIDGIERGQVNIFNAEGPEANIASEAPTLLEILKWEVNDTLLDKINISAQSTGKIKIRELRDLGLKTSFSPQTLALAIHVPPELRKIQDIDFNNALREPKYKGPNWFSGYSNFYVSRLFESEKKEPTIGRIENVLNVEGFILDTSANYDESDRYPWIRGPVRIIKDATKSSLRWMVGDFDFPVDNFQNNISLGGVLVFKEYAINPFLVPYPQSETEFYLETPSTVEVFLNGRFIETLYLAAGRQNIKNLPIQQGANDIKLVIKDQFGRIKILNFPFITDFELLDRGFHRFAYAYGKARNLVNGLYIYDSPTGSFFHHYGVTKNITLGLHGQGNDLQKIYGPRAYFGTNIGLFGFDYAQSDLVGYGTDSAYSIRYRTLGNPRSVLRLQGTHYGTNFAPLGVTIPNNLFKTNLNGSWTHFLADNLSMSIGGTYDYHKDSLGDRRTFYAQLSQRLKLNVDASLHYSETRDPSTDTFDHRIFASVQWVDTEFTHSLFAAHDSLLDSNQISWQYNPGRDVGSPIYNALYSDSPDLNTYQVGAGYIGYRGIAEVDQVQSTNKTGAVPDKNSTRIAASTGLAYTSRGIGFSRPITDSFVMLNARGALSDYEIDVNPTLKNPRAKSDFWGPAIVPDLQSYYTDTVYAQTVDPFASSLFSKNTFRVKPTYKSGVNITIVGKTAVMLSGQLVPNWNLKTGIITPVDPPGEPIEFFTNKSGEFYIDSVPPGSYDLQIDEESRRYRFKVPAKIGPFDLGKIKY